MTAAEFIVWERASADRHTFLDGVVAEKGGENHGHGTVSTNLIGLFHPQLRRAAMHLRFKGTLVYSGPRPLRGRAGMFSFPDIAVFRDEPDYLDAARDVLTNPAVILEVLSPSTEAFDCGTKFERYRLWNPTLTDYVLVSQSHPLTELYTRQPDGSWRFTEYRGLEAVCVVEAVGVRLPLAEVYERVAFPPADDGQPANS